MVRQRKASPATKPRPAKKIEAIQLLWKMYPPPWKVEVRGERGIILDCSKQRVVGFEVEFDGVYHLGLVAAVNAAAKQHPPKARLQGYRYLRLADVIDDEHLNLAVLPPLPPAGKKAKKK